MKFFKTLFYVILGKKVFKFVDKKIDKFIAKKEIVYIVYKEGKNENKESTKKEEPKFEEKEVEKNNKWILKRMMFNKTGIILFYFTGRKWIAVVY